MFFSSLNVYTNLTTTIHSLNPDMVGNILRKDYPVVEIDDNVLMPNHFHGIIIIKDVETSRWDVSNEKSETYQRPVSIKIIS